ncbi:MAG: 4-hydroxythreonine-4-phosphate dehydrogenase PdxA [Pseudomonadota bacterium]
MTGRVRPVAITCGEPAGIGPEVAAAAFKALRGEVPMLWLGDPRHLPAGTPYQEVHHADEAAGTAPMRLPVLPADFGPPAEPGSPKPAHAHHVIDMIARGVEMVQSGKAAALCTAPINKKALITGADFGYPGHTEYLAALAGVKDVVMMLASDLLRVVPATIHIPIDKVPRVLTPARLRRVIEITHQGLKSHFGISTPRLAVAGLNPHAGEDGAMGQQETAWIGPLIREMMRDGFDLTGPLPADTMFHTAARARYDAAICMYHDQALIPIKTLDFDQGVNVTLGLPFIRTSPDHGTAFDIAGQGRANPASMIAALRLAHRMAQAQ